ncbi:hypothetical protein amb1737 [Paramagnetospirillum magneticum AMB-1]|uniref:Uncharacterized protein n=1 Tax=Paramagnetospirillum magneticum (strain ATCC 700264 / AMB-1) TaxID=342108 RepID=Q2W6I4_PARM1|nr:hypothetical protein amb1737 [Paramagnetospirillum magneticum AMB-1]
MASEGVRHSPRNGQPEGAPNRTGDFPVVTKATARAAPNGEGWTIFPSPPEKHQPPGCRGGAPRCGGSLPRTRRAGRWAIGLHEARTARSLRRRRRRMGIP